MVLNNCLQLRLLYIFNALNNPGQYYPYKASISLRMQCQENALYRQRNRYSLSLMKI